MDENEKKEILGLIEKAGREAYECDTPVPLYLGPAHCGNPTEPGEGVDEMIMLPRALLKWELVFCLRADGDSMNGLQIEDGDMLRVEAGRTVHDNDVVVAWLDGEVTVKSYVTDEDGARWLVPANDDYEPICLEEKMNWRIVGVVTSVEKQQLRMKTGDAMKRIRRTKDTAQVPLTNEMINEAVEEISQQVNSRRKWIGVYRQLKERKAEWATDYDKFCENVEILLPGHNFLPNKRELQRMDVMSFAKPVRYWDRNDAPVTGTRFDEYLLVAERFGRLLREKQGKNRVKTGRKNSRFS